MKRLALLACACVLVAGMAGCSSRADYSNSTLTGEVTAVAGTAVTLQLGELTATDTAAGGDMPGGGTDEGTGDGGTQGDNAGGDMQGAGTSGGGASGGNTQGGDETGGDTSGGDTSGGGASSGGMQGGNTQGGDMQGGGAPGGDMPGGAGGDMGTGGSASASTFIAGEETAIIDLDGASSITSEKASGDETVTLDDISVGDVLVIEVGDRNVVESVTVKSLDGDGTQGGDADSGGMPGGDMGGGGAPGGDMGGGDMPGGDMGGGPGGGSGEASQGTAANTIDEDGTYKNETYTSTGDDENALRVTGATAELDSITVDKSGGSSSNAESGDFYGANAALLVTDGAQATITGATVESSAQNGNGVFSYGEGTVVDISDSTITTTSDNSGGLQTTGGGTMNANNLTIETSGSSAAAIRSDRGGGTVVVDRGTYTSNGHNSPAIYSTADITVTNAKLTATGSEALVIEGKNAIKLENCEVEGNMSDTQGASSDENVHNVMIYQSMSGDAESGTSTFSMKDGTLTSDNGDVFYITNTQCTVDLSNVDIVNKDDDSYLIRVIGNSGSRGWGQAGSNGAQAEMTLDDQTLEGDIVVDTISKLDMTFTNGSSLTGTINVVDNAAGGTAVDDNAVITVEEGCTWTLTDDCTVTSLDNDGTINYNGHTITLADGTVLS